MHVRLLYSSLCCPKGFANQRSQLLQARGALVNGLGQSSVALFRTRALPSVIHRNRQTRRRRWNLAAHLSPARCNFSGKSHLANLRGDSAVLGTCAAANQAPAYLLPGTLARSLVIAHLLDRTGTYRPWHPGLDLCHNCHPGLYLSSIFSKAQFPTLKAQKQSCGTFAPKHNIPARFTVRAKSFARCDDLVLFSLPINFTSCLASTARDGYLGVQQSKLLWWNHQTGRYPHVPHSIAARSRVDGELTQHGQAPM